MLTRNPNRSRNPDAQIVAHDFVDPQNPQPIWYVPEPPEDSSDSDMSMDSDDVEYYYGKVARNRNDKEYYRHKMHKSMKKGQNQYGKIRSATRSLMPHPIRDKFSDRTVALNIGKAGSTKTTTTLAMVNLQRKLIGEKPVYVINGKPAEGGFKKNGMKEIPIDTLVTCDQNERRYRDACIEFKYKKQADKDMPPQVKIDWEKKIDRLKPRKVKSYQLTPFYHKIAKNCIWIFDDFKKGEMWDKGLFLLNDITERGRADKMDCYIITHANSDGNKTRDLLGEINMYTVFQKDAPKNRQRLYRDYLDLPKATKDSFEKALRGSRWLTIYPEICVAVTQHKAWIYQCT